MKKNPGIRLVLVSILALLFLIAIYPTIQWIQMPKEKRNKAELQFEDPKKYKELSDEQKREVDSIKELKNRSINLGLDLQGGIHVVLQADLTGLTNSDMKANAVNQALEVIRNRVDEFGVSEPTIVKQGENRIVVDLAGIKDPDRAKKLLNTQGKLEFKMVDLELSDPKNFKDLKEGILYDDISLPEDKEILFNYEKDQAGQLIKREPVIVFKQPVLTGEYLKNAGIQMGQFNDAVVSFSLKSAGADIFFKVTSENVGKHMAIVLDRKIRSYPRIKQALHDGGIIEGRFNIQDAKDLALVLRAGATPVTLKIIEQRIVGPSLGDDSINAGVNAGLYGLIAVIIFMLIYYKFAGLMANISLFLNMYFLLGILIMIKYTFTLPGLAGVVLTIGMAVDANVLIFERIKEELKVGKSLIASVDAGFEKAFRTILDANLTTLITAVILSQFGTGPIKGFAVTLAWGIGINMFTAVYVSHNLFNWVIHKFHFQKISI